MFEFDKKFKQEYISSQKSFRLYTVVLISSAQSLQPVIFSYLKL